MSKELTENEKIGKQIIEWFGLKPSKGYEKGDDLRWDTKHGNKSLVGLGATVTGIVESVKS